MGNKSKTKLRFAKLIKEQQLVVDKNDNPRERQQLDKLRRRLEDVEIERNAHSKS